MKIYRLSWDYNHSGDSEIDAHHISFENSDKASTLFLNPRYKNKLPQTLSFRANFNVIPYIDYPLTDLNIPILSDQMILLLNSIQKIEAIYTNVLMIDDTYLEDIYDENKSIKSNVKTVTSYKVITLLERENDCFDFENSIYKPSELNPSIPGYIKKLVLKYKTNLPPIFRIKESPSTLLITESAKSILESNNIKGCRFEEIETT